MPLHMREDLIEVIAILDMSGSMSSIASDTIGGFNTYLNELRINPNVKVTMYLFNTRVWKEWNRVDLKECKPLTSQTYRPDEMTALHDAMGIAVSQMKIDFDKMPEDEKPGHVSFFVSTDGEENSSKKYSKQQIKELVTQCTEEYKWTFQFAGANIDAFAAGEALGFQRQNIANIQNDAQAQHDIYAAVAMKQNIMYNQQRAQSHYQMDSMMMCKCAKMDMQEAYNYQRKPQVNIKRQMSPIEYEGNNIELQPIQLQTGQYFYISPVANPNLAIGIEGAPLDYKCQQWQQSGTKSQSFSSGTIFKNEYYSLTLGCPDQTGRVGSKLITIQGDEGNIVWDQQKIKGSNNVQLQLEPGLVLEAQGNKLGIAKLVDGKQEQMFKIFKNIKFSGNEAVLQAQQKNTVVFGGHSIVPYLHQDKELIIKGTESVTNAQCWTTKKVDGTSFANGGILQNYSLPDLFLGSNDNPSKQSSSIVSISERYNVNIVWEMRQVNGEKDTFIFVLDEGLVMEAVNENEVKIMNFVEGRKEQWFVFK